VFGVSPATIKNMLRLLDAPKAVQKAVETGAITTTDGYKLARLDADEAKAKVDELAAEPKTGVRKRTRAEAKKARKIVGVASLRGKREIQEMSDRVANEEKMKEMHRAGALAALHWVLGGDDLERLMG